MKRLKNLFVSAIIALLLVFGLTIITPATAEQGGSDPCCRNGYKSWKDPGILGGGTNFNDCWCHSHKGKDMLC